MLTRNMSHPGDGHVRQLALVCCYSLLLLLPACSLAMGSQQRQQQRRRSRHEAQERGLGDAHLRGKSAHTERRRCGPSQTHLDSCRSSYSPLCPFFCFISPDLIYCIGLVTCPLCHCKTGSSWLACLASSPQDDCRTTLQRRSSGPLKIFSCSPHICLCRRQKLAHTHHHTFRCLKTPAKHSCSPPASRCALLDIQSDAPAEFHARVRTTAANGSHLCRQKWWRDFP